MDDRRLTPASWREAGRTVLARSGKMLFGLGMAASLAESASGARKDKRAEEESATRKEERRDARTEESERNSQDQNQGSANAETSETSSGRPKDENQENADRSEKRDRREERTDQDDESVSDESTGGERRPVTRKQEADAGSSGDGGSRNERPTEELAQRARDDEPIVNDTVDDVVTTPTVPSNPNIPVDTAPDPTDADLFIEANPDVIASVSTSGGFAFARSGDVIAVSGPDGAQIIQSDDPDDVVTPSPSPDAPADDGGNNDLDFTS